jgi:hypothetical protein
VDKTSILFSWLVRWEGDLKNPANDNRVDIAAPQNGIYIVLESNGSSIAKRSSSSNSDKLDLYENSWLGKKPSLIN